MENNMTTEEWNEIYPVEKEPVITKSLLGDLWKVQYENKIVFMNQKRMEELLKEIKENAEGQNKS